MTPPGGAPTTPDPGVRAAARLLVRGWPPPTPEQLARVRALLPPVGVADRSDTRRQPSGTADGPTAAA